MPESTNVAAILAKRDKQMLGLLGGAFILVVVAVTSIAVVAALALQSRKQTSMKATARIDKITADNRRLNAKAERNSERIGQLVTALDAVSEQVRQLGGRPVAQSDRSPLASAAPGRSPSTTTTTPAQRPSAASPSTTTTTQPPATAPPTTRPPAVGCVLTLCI